MTLTRSDIVVTALAACLAASCASLSGLSGGTGATDGGADGSGACGLESEPCCNHAICEGDLKCSQSVCVRPDGGSGRSSGSGSGQTTPDSGADSGSTSAPPSCAAPGPGRDDCGSASESCCTSPTVQGGTFFRTYTNDGSGPTGESDPATVGTFRLDKYLVTVGRFREFVNAWNGGAGYTPSPGSGKHTHLNGGQGLAVGPNVDAGQTYEQGWLAAYDSSVAPTDNNLACGGAWASTPGSQENLPLSCMSWYEAYAFCIWDGGFLPSDAELEYAAVGGSDQREYPWGIAAPGTDNQYAIYECYYPGCGTPNFSAAPVGTASLGAGKWGQLDLAGELFAFDLDSPGFSDPCMDCYTPPTTVAQQDCRSIAYDSNIAAGSMTTLNPWAMHNLGADNRQSYLGFRCARVP
jgi:formylglycine-generating enzyme